MFVSIPEERLNDVVKIQKTPEGMDPREKIVSALDTPLGTDRLGDIGKPGKTVALAIQYAHAADILAPLTQRIVETLEISGVKDEDVAQIISGDIYSPHAGEVTAGISPRKITHSFVKSAMLPTNSFLLGSPAQIDKNFKEADIKISVGVVEPQYLTGYTGAPHTVAPGLLDVGVIQNLYKDAFRRDYKDSFPLQEVSEEILRLCNLAEVNFTVNVIIDKGEVTDVVAGEPEKAFTEATKRYEERYRCQVKNPVDAVIAGAGGAPFDSEVTGLYQGIENSLKVLEKGGQLVIAADCEKWIQSKPLLTSLLNQKEDLASLRHRRIEDLLEFPHVFLLVKANEYADISLVATMPHYYTKRALKFRAYRTVNQAFQSALNRVEKNAKILAVQDTYHTILTMA